MESTNKTASEILLEAADLLKQEGVWGKGAYFLFPLKVIPPTGCTMCAHGAIAYCGKPVLKNLLLDKKLSSDELVGLAPTIAKTIFYNEKGGAYYVKLAKQEDISLEQYLVKYFGEVGLAHYKAFQVGLNFSYNDRYNTTKQDVINKLREAALL